EMDEMGGGKKIMEETGEMAKEMGSEAGSIGEMMGTADIAGAPDSKVHGAFHLSRASSATQRAQSIRASLPGNGEGEGRTQEVDLLQLIVEQQTPYDRRTPPVLSTLSPLAPQAAPTRSFTLSVAMANAPAASVTSGETMQWLINGLSYQVDED